MGLLDAVKRALRRPEAPDATDAGSGGTGEDDEEVEMIVPEVTSGELMAEMTHGAGEDVLLLDCRESYERAQGFIPQSMHIAMNSIPSRLQELDPEQDIVVYCAHGNRSYGVTGWLIQQGYRARSLKGGIVDWQQKHGPVERSYRSET